MFEEDARISFMQLIDDMSEEEIESILKPVENELMHQPVQLPEEDLKDIPIEAPDDIPDDTSENI